MFFKPKENVNNDPNRLTAKDISAIPFFCDVANEDIQILADILRVRKIWQGRCIVNEGDVQSEMYVILEGSVDVLKKDKKGNLEILAELRPPQIFGEMSLISGGRRSATVRAKEDTVVVELSCNDFEKLIKIHPKLAVNIVRKIADTLNSRLRKLNAAYVELM